jgi:hypothetical protein
MQISWLVNNRTLQQKYGFPIVNFPIICRNLPAALTYRLYISQLIRYSGACYSYHNFLDREQGRAPSKIGKNMIFWCKIVIFHTKYPKIFTPPSAIGNNMIFWRKIVIFHTKYSKIFAPPSARCNFLKCAPLT